MSKVGQLHDYFARSVAQSVTRLIGSIPNVEAIVISNIVENIEMVQASRSNRCRNAGSEESCEGNTLIATVR